MAPRILNPDGNEITNGQVPPWLKAAYVLGIPGVIALFYVYITAMSWTPAMAAIARDITTLKQEHRDQAYTQRAICLSLAKLAATDPALCEPPK